MSNRRTDQDYDSEDLLMNEDFDILDDDMDEEEQEARSARSRAFNMDMRHRIEDRLEERRLRKELNDYESFELDDDMLH
ncbi:MAG: hypothetical protein CL537_14140 [Alcanivoracaceae bacterium]|uniref:PA3496 family putative envelope integrity protein n=1 Tax=Alcanivorax sp. MD8A TaxID=1177157 RepID=UPI000C4E3FFD|nr:hypothetical protein [Alcanivorax sp. MD8A]MAX56626.1 hypothetical protein [Alcanivoracaceae bacterium]MCG8439022.1 hypothetical protein [Pseudomonadales bacterium]MED5431194.1 hypothetical protein [Pseudomonadota bacterium]PNE03507.1 hypothetical protein A15D_00975 [Alcanivorax sp. MD8A]|tara:strand:- start:4289 stop:4525 length:237 start_codon:yes stop_codon:yes gene_type:complete